MTTIVKHLNYIVHLYVGSDIMHAGCQQQKQQQKTFWNKKGNRCALEV